jgi:hypothetical protein
MTFLPLPLASIIIRLSCVISAACIVGYIPSPFTSPCCLPFPTTVSACPLLQTPLQSCRCFDRCRLLCQGLPCPLAPAARGSQGAAPARQQSSSKSHG